MLRPFFIPVAAVLRLVYRFGLAQGAVAVYKTNTGDDVVELSVVCFLWLFLPVL